MDELYVLTDAVGFTTCTAPTNAALHKEAGRALLIAPVTVFHWRQDGRRNWHRVDEFQWSGGDRRG